MADAPAPPWAAVWIVDRPRVRRWYLALSGTAFSVSLRCYLSDRLGWRADWRRQGDSPLHSIAVCSTSVWLAP
eukprot:6823095-Pyramimonas_sp.AAC.1